MYLSIKNYKFYIKKYMHLISVTTTIFQKEKQDKNIAE